ncbi:hypothetical protein [Nannocystis punicea]|uniref:Uncharacterized protein n=1 Tax=Nannocystis punicea TaxID=2995304 RepID=A0ABY7HAF2_9BACT|nr:hypothetical protein [Nannocystis poenicansa]WAS96253.1 hypothetical protein O0S08_08825 [Nannocystis poenicansa]
MKATDYGRSEGWDVVLEERAIACLSEPRFEDMFWISYRVTPLTDDPELAAQLLTPEFWREESRRGRLRYRSRALGVFAPHAFASLGDHEPGRATMRALYLTPETLAAALRLATPSPDETLVEPRPEGWFACARRWLRGRVAGRR